MSQHIDLLEMPGLWTAMPTQLSNGLRFNIYVDPTKQFFSLSPVTTVEKLNAWYSLQCQLAAKTYTPASVKEAIRMREMTWSAQTRSPHANLELEEWHLTA